MILGKSVSSGRLLLNGVGLLVTAIPVAFGWAHVMPWRPQNVGAQARPQFDVASVKPCDTKSLPPGARSGSIDATEGRLSMNCVSVRSFISWAYIEYADPQRPRFFKRPPIEGGPSWMNADHYTINAETERKVTPQMMQGPMLQSILEDRFKLKIRRVTREVPVYELTVAKGGFKMQPAAEGSCTPRDPKNLTRRLGGNENPYCGQAHFSQKGINVTVELRSVTMEEFGNWIATSNFDRTIIDKTGIIGKYDFKMEYSLDQSSPRYRAQDDDSADPSVGLFPSIFSVVQQFGLKLVPAKGPGEFIVIDSIEKPSGN